jgi:hypothetical protein
MEEAPENGKESSHSAHANGMNEWMNAKSEIILNIKRNSQHIWKPTSYILLIYLWHRYATIVINFPVQYSPSLIF